MSEGTSQLVDKINSIPLIKELQDALTSASKQASDLHPMVKTVIDTLIGLLTTMSNSLGGITSWVDPYAPMATDAIKTLEESYPTLKKSSTEICNEFSTAFSSQIPESVKTSIRSVLLSIVNTIISSLNKIKTAEAKSIQDLVSGTLLEFQQVKDVINHATALADNVAENETATKAAAASAEVILKQLGPEAKAKYDALPDATSKARFLSEEGWKIMSEKMTSVNDQITTALPEPFKSGYTAAVSLTNKLSTDLNQQLPSNEDVLKKIQLSVDTISKYLESLQKWLNPEEESSSL